jgi:hypothetical protein
MISSEKYTYSNTFEKNILTPISVASFTMKNTNALPSEPPTLRKIYIFALCLFYLGKFYYSLLLGKIYLLPAYSTWEKYYCLLL